jgi:protein SCO1/2
LSEAVLRTTDYRLPLVFVAGAVWVGFFVYAKVAPHFAPPKVSAEKIADQSGDTPTGGPLPILWQVPAFSYVDQSGHTITDHDLRGHVWVSDFFFAGCTSICPAMTLAMSQLQATITNPAIEFISFDVDPDHDTPKVLADYGQMWHADNARWHFLSTDREHLAATAAGMKTFVQPPTETSPIQHSAIFILADQNGNVRGVYDSTDSPALRQLSYDAMALAGTPLAKMPATNGPPSLRETINPIENPGAALFVNHGCEACHSQARVAPPLVGFFGNPVLLNDGKTVIADEAYLRESIVDPGAKIVAGYPNMMPSYRGQLDETQLEQLIAYVKSLIPAHQ